MAFSCVTDTILLPVRQTLLATLSIHDNLSWNSLDCDATVERQAISSGDIYFEARSDDDDVIWSFGDEKLNGA